MRVLEVIAHLKNWGLEAMPRLGFSKFCIWSNARAFETEKTFIHVEIFEMWHVFTRILTLLAKSKKPVIVGESATTHSKQIVK